MYPYNRSGCPTTTLVRYPPIVSLGPNTPSSENGSPLAGRMGWMAAKTARTVTNTSAMVAVSLSIRGPHHVVPVEAEPCPPVDPTSEDVDQGRDDDYRGCSAHRRRLGCLSSRASQPPNR